MPDEISYIEERTFAGCTLLARVTMSDAVQGMEPDAFAGCPVAEAQADAHVGEQPGAQPAEQPGD